MIKTGQLLHQVRLRLTLLFTAITGLILAVMTGLCLHVAETALRDNSMAAFQSDAVSLIAELEQEEDLTRWRLFGMESSGTYLLYLADNGIPLAFSSRSSRTVSLSEQALDYCRTHFSAAPTDIVSPAASSHLEFSFTSDEGQSYFACAAQIVKNGGSLEMVLLMPLAVLETRIMDQRFLFLAIVSGAILLLAFFCHWFTARLLSPIEESQDRQTRFVAAASHELRTPLTVLINCLSALRRAEPSEQDSFLKIMEKESARMARLIEDMLTLASADSHSFSIRKETAELDTLLLDSFEAFESMARQQGILLRIQLPEDPLPACVCDGQRIAQVVAILLNNALSYHRKADSPSDERWVCLSLNHADGWFLLTVADNGPGIPDGEKKRIFERFYRTDPSRGKKEHFGLGLCIAKEITDAHGGYLQVKDTAGGGSTFLLKLPG